MTVHIKKLSVGSTSLESLKESQKRRLAKGDRIVHVTRNRPRRADELLDGGSIYWIIRGVMTARQAICDIVGAQRNDGSFGCGIVLSPEIVPVMPIRMRIFQGWRYLEIADTPPDLSLEDGDDMPTELVAELRALGIF